MRIEHSGREGVEMNCSHLDLLDSYTTYDIDTAGTTYLPRARKPHCDCQQSTENGG